VVCVETELTRKENPMKLWLANFSPPQREDDELRAVMHECVKREVITRLTREADDLQAGAVLKFDQPGRKTLCEAQRRLSEPYTGKPAQLRAMCRYSRSGRAVGSVAAGSEP
jgi:hypothetical protein